MALCISYAVLRAYLWEIYSKSLHSFKAGTLSMALFCALLPANIELDAKRKVQNLGVVHEWCQSFEYFSDLRNLKFKSSETKTFLHLTTTNIAAYRTPRDNYTSNHEV